MGYSTKFRGKINIQPALSAADFLELRQLAKQDQRDKGPWQIPDAPSNYCQWKPTDDAAALEWDGNEKFDNSVEWMGLLAERLAERGYTLNGEIEAQGEEIGDHWKLIVENNVVSEQPL